METLTSRGGLMPEQVWDSADIPALELVRGQPSGSAMPLVWAHAEHVKLCRSLADGAVFDTPPQPVKRYLVDKLPPRCAIWRADLPITTIAAGRVLRIDMLEAAVLHWSRDDWTRVTDTALHDTGLGLHVAEIPTAGLPAGTRILFTWRYQGSGTWAGANYSVEVA